jgi:site-specific DNA-adenine methylase
MLGIPSLFSYYGGKWRAAPRYPAPLHSTIIEPFAGAAGYAHRYPDHNVILVERNPKVAATWRYLLRASAAEVRALPLLDPGQTVNDLNICEEARYLIGWSVNSATTAPCQSPSKWMRTQLERGRLCAQFWGEAKRERIAQSVERIRHWRLIEGDYTDAPDVLATWFIDPPYAKAGKHYVSKFTEYAALAAWCRERRGQTLVCENVGADWLPFRHFADIASNRGRHGGKVSREAIWEQHTS